MGTGKSENDVGKKKTFLCPTLSPLNERPLGLNGLSDWSSRCLLREQAGCCRIFPQIFNKEERMPKRIETAGPYRLATGWCPKWKVQKVEAEYICPHLNSP